ncbi:ATP-binding cassette domain-containing protein [Rhodoferax sp.]|uniref:phosphonate ABC transporter ATP-binding protein n=1 Tax=Rhodoferax sp. TaxID=50421 RepID=UPI001EB67E12|nr:ATP-binding cassette domain-containing protein [Rhodoferax sp.]MBT9506176.1 ATP-binding cassette domain-containing protein [Rhodoferax sp.]
MNKSALIQIHNLICQAGGKTMLDMAHWSVTAGERIAIVGHNGAGKSTLLRCLGGFVHPSRGDAVVLGRQLGPHTPPKALRQLRVEVGQVMQGLHLVQRVSALDNVLMGVLGRRSGWRTWVRMHAAADVAAAEAALSDVGLLSKADERVDRLSGGEKQKVAIARMLMQRPKLILADEPTASLDPLAASEVCSLLARAAAGATLITVVHNPSLLPILADRVLGLKQGRIAFDLPLAQVDDRQLASLYRPDTSATEVPWLGPLFVESPEAQS